MIWAHYLEFMAYGAVAAIGFGILFNVEFKSIPWCGGCGAFALAVRLFCLSHDFTFEAATFVAALALGIFVRLFDFRTGLSRNALASVGCIPMVPGSFAAKAILGFFALTDSASSHSPEILVEAFTNFLRALFTIGAIGTGMAIPTLWRK